MPTTTFEKGGDSTNLHEASHEWARRPADQRFASLEELQAKVHGRRLRSRSVDIDIDRVKVVHPADSAASAETAGRLVINSGLTPCEPSHWSFGQLAGMVGAPAAYLRKLPLELTADCLNHGLMNHDREAVKFMTVESETDNALNTLQAVTSTKYGRIWDADVVAAVMRLNERTGGKFAAPKAYGGPAGLYASDRDVFMFMVDGGSRLDVGPRAKLNRGFIVKNSETGAAVFELCTFLFNEVCGNHIIWGARDINRLAIRHTAGGPSRFDLEAAPLLMQYAQSSAATEETVIRKAMAALLPKEEERERFALAANLTRGEFRNAVTFAKSEEGKCETVWDLVQGLTAYARGFDYLDARTDLEKRAGALLKRFEDA